MLRGAPVNESAAPGGNNPAPPVPASPPTSQPTSPAVESPTPQIDNEALRQKLQEALNKLVPQLKQAVVTFPEKKVELLTPVAQIKKQIDSGELHEAKKGILSLGELLKKLRIGGVPAPATETASTNNDEQRFQLLLEETEPRLEVAVGSGANDAAKLQKLMQLALAKSRVGDFETAIRALEGLAKALSGLPTVGESKATESVPDSVASSDDQNEAAIEFARSWAAARKTLRAAIDDVQAQLAEFAVALLSSNDPNMEWVAEEGLTQLVGKLRESATVIDKSVAKNPARVVKLARPALAQLEKQLSSPQVQACDDNKFGVAVNIKSTIEHAVKHLSETLDLVP